VYIIGASHRLPREQRNHERVRTVPQSQLGEWGFSLVYLEFSGTLCHAPEVPGLDQLSQGFIPLHRSLKCLSAPVTPHMLEETHCPEVSGMAVSVAQVLIVWYKPRSRELAWVIRVFVACLRIAAELRY